MSLHTGPGQGFRVATRPRPVKAPGQGLDTAFGRRLYSAHPFRRSHDGLSTDGSDPGKAPGPHPCQRGGRHRTSPQRPWPLGADPSRTGGGDHRRQPRDRRDRHHHENHRRRPAPAQGRTGHHPSHGEPRRWHGRGAAAAPAHVRDLSRDDGGVDPLLHGRHTPRSHTRGDSRRPRHRGNQGGWDPPGQPHKAPHRLRRQDRQWPPQDDGLRARQPPRGGDLP